MPFWKGAEEKSAKIHVSSRECEAPPGKVREKFSHLKQRSPPAGRPHLSQEENKDIEQAAQKEKLHTELKKVLLLKGQKASVEQEPAKMGTPIKITEETLQASEMVEVIVETEAKAGMSGIVISGGGKEGVIIRDVVKDSPAAKTLPLLEGDQLLSAHVFFENVKYEEALKILQCMEPYKVSYCLKRAVQSSDVTVSPTSGSVEVKGPKTKMPKMTVKSLTSMKKKKKKEPSQVKGYEEVSIEAHKGSEISVGSMDIPAVDVEFSFPKFSKLIKTKSAVETTTDIKSTKVSTKISTAEEKRAKIKFPRLRVKDAAAGVKVTSTKTSSELEVKEKETSTFGISVPKFIKSPKVDVVVPKTEVELSPPKPEMKTKEEKIIKAPQVEIDIPLSSIKAETSDISATESVKMAILNTTAKIPDVEIKVPTSQVEAHTGKLSTTQMSNIAKCLTSLEKESYVAIEGISKTEIKLPSVEIAAPKLDDLSLSKIEGKAGAEPSDSGKIFQIKIPHLGLPSKSPEDDLDVKKHDGKKPTEDKSKMPSLKSPEIGLIVSKGKFDEDISEKKAVMKLPSLDISAPKVDFDINIPKGKLDTELSIELDAPAPAIPDVTLKIPTISPPKVGMKVKEAYAESPKLKTGKLQTDIKAETTESETLFEIPDVTLKMPKIGIPLLGTKAETETPHAEVKTGKIAGESPDIKLKRPKIKLPSFGISLSKEKSDLSLLEKDTSEKETVTETDGKPKIPLIKVPSVDISLPKVPDIQLVKHEVTLPSLKADIKAPELEVPETGDLQLKMPKVSLPKFDLSTKIEKPLSSSPKVGKHDKKTDTKIPEVDLDVKGDKMTFSKVDIYLPKIKTGDLDILSPKTVIDISVDKPKLGMKIPKVVCDAIAFNAESKVDITSVKVPDLEIVTPKFDVDLTMPKVKAEASECLIKEPECDLQLPKLNLPKLSDVAKDMAVELDVPKITSDVSFSQLAAHLKGPELKGKDVSDTGAKISLPKALLGFGKSTEDHILEVTGVKLKEKTDVKIHKERPDAQSTDAKIKLPSVQLPSVEITVPKIPDVDIDASIPEVAIDVPSTEERTAGIPSKKDIKSKSTKFSFHKLGISGPKIKKGIEVETKESHLERENEMPLKGPRMKMPKFGITFPKAKHDIDVDVAKLSKKKTDISVCKDDDSSGGKIKLPSVKLPSVDILTPKLEVDIGVSKEDAPLVTDKPTDISIDIPDVKVNLPKFSLPRFGSKIKRGEMGFEMESSKSGEKVSPLKSLVSRGDSGDKTAKEPKMKMPAIKLPSFGISKKEAEISDATLEVALPECKIQKSKEHGKDSKVETDVKETSEKTTFMKMPTFKMSPKFKAHDVSLGMKGSKEDLHLPDVHVKVPHIALPSIGMKSDKSADIPLIKSEAKVAEWIQEQEIHLEKIKMPSLEVSVPQEIQSLLISVPCVKGDVCTSLPKAEVGVSDISTKAHEGDMKLPKLATFNVPTPKVELDISLPKTFEHKPDLALEKSEMNLKIPKVELPKFGENEQDVCETEGKLKIKMPHVDISLPKIKADEEDIPFIEGEMKMYGSDFEVRSKEETFSLPSVELPKMSTPKIQAPELELDISLSKEDDRDAEISSPESRPSDIKFKMPKMKLPKFSGSNDMDDETTKVDVKTSKTKESTDSGLTGFKLKLPKLHVGSLKARGVDDVSVEKEGEHKITKKGNTKSVDHEDSEDRRGFKIKMPSFGISKDNTDASTEPLHLASDGAEVKFKMPKVNIPDVGFSRSEAGGNETTLEKESKSTTAENLELDLGLKIPKIKMASFGMPGRKVDDDMNMSLEEDKEANKSLFKVPDLEISTPKMKAHAEYDVDGTLEHDLSKEKEVVTKKKLSNKIIESAEEDSGKKYKVKLPKFAISLPKSVQTDVEISAPRLQSEGEDSEASLKGKSLEQDNQTGKKFKKTIFSVGKNKEKHFLMSDAGEGDGPEMKMKMPKIKMKPTFGMSRGKVRGNEVNGEFDGSAKEDTDINHDGTTKSSKLKFPKLGFSSNKTISGDININGLNGETDVSAPNAQEGMVKIGKIKLPKVEFSSPHKTKETDGEMNLKLVKAEESDSKEEGKENTLTTKFKSPKITFSGFKKKDKGEGHQISSSTRTELATVENIKEGEEKTGRAKMSLGFLSGRSKGEYTVDNSGIEKGSMVEAKEKSAKYNLPKLSLSSKAESEVEVTTKTHKIVDESSQEGLKISLPKVGFTTEDEEQIEEEVTGGILKITKIKQIITETVAEKTLAL